MTEKTTDTNGSVSSVADDADTDDSATTAGNEAKNDAKDSAEPTVTDTESGSQRRRLQASVSVRSLLVSGLIALLVAGIAVMTWLYLGAKGQLDQQAREAAATTRAEQVALDYAANAAAMNFKDIPAWKGKLVAGTSPELKDRLGEAADQMEQILVPLQWDSTARPLAAKVRSKVGSAYVVDAFVSVMTKTAQSQDPLQSTATYSVTVDSAKDWQITDVGGIGAAVQAR
jgi:hypothetical protein